MNESRRLALFLCSFSLPSSRLVLSVSPLSPSAMPAYADRQLLWHIAEDTCAAYRASHKRSRCAIALPRRNEPERLHVAIRRLYAGSPQREKRTLDTARGSYPTAKLSNPSKGKASGGSNAENSSRSNNNESNTSKASSIVQTALEKPKQLSKAARASLSAASFRSAHDELRSTSSSRWCETTNQEKVVPLEQLPLEFPSEGYPPTLPRVTDEWLLRLAMGLNRPGVADDHFSIPTSWQIENNEVSTLLGERQFIAEWWRHARPEEKASSEPLVGAERA